MSFGSKLSFIFTVFSIFNFFFDILEEDDNLKFYKIDEYHFN